MILSAPPFAGIAQCIGRNAQRAIASLSEATGLRVAAPPKHKEPIPRRDKGKEGPRQQRRPGGASRHQLGPDQRLRVEPMHVVEVCPGI